MLVLLPFPPFSFIRPAQRAPLFPSATLFRSLLLAALALGIGLLRASLPRLDGARAEVGLTAAVRITRDSRVMRDRESTRLHSSHRCTSHADLSLNEKRRAHV